MTCTRNNNINITFCLDLEFNESVGEHTIAANEKKNKKLVLAGRWSHLIYCEQSFWKVMQRSQCHWNNNQKCYKQANGIQSHGSLLLTIDTHTHTHARAHIQRPLHFNKLNPSAGSSLSFFFMWIFRLFMLNFSRYNYVWENRFWLKNFARFN